MPDRYRLPRPPLKLMGKRHRQSRHQARREAKSASRKTKQNKYRYEAEELDALIIKVTDRRGVRAERRASRIETSPTITHADINKYIVQNPQGGWDIVP